MSKSRTETVRADPGTFVFVPLDHLTGPARKREINFAEWGVCECDGYYWLGGRTVGEEKDVLRVSALDALERRNTEYPDWGDEEVYVIFGFDKWSGEFEWTLLSYEELAERNGRIQHKILS